MMTQPMADYSSAGSDIYKSSTVSVREAVATQPITETYTPSYRTTGLDQSIGLTSALGERFEPSTSYDIGGGEAEVTKKTTVTTVRSTRSGYSD
ncbi:unnamed protein product [Anisakis simplex]|uniref:Uncharacterized protein n=1 Tax=Anisakis simplex TaxID=6269 RepID=A0A0M3KD66_ANISI|nr:unnamed protein product [Anisakis simplex]